MRIEAQRPGRRRRAAATLETSQRGGNARSNATQIGHPGTLAYEPWPAWDEDVLKQKEVELPVQVNGKVRGRVTLPADALAAAKACPSVLPYLEGKTVRKEIVVPGRMINLVVG